MDVAAHNTALIATLAVPDTAARADGVARRLREEIIAEGGHLLELLPRPIFSEPDQVSALGERARALVALQTRLIHDLLEREGRPAFLDRFGIEPALRDLVNWEELIAPSYLIARLDLLYLAEGFRCCEINVDSCVAGAEIFDTARDTFLALGLDTHWLPARPLDQLAGLIARTARGRGAARIVILDWSIGGGSGGKGYLNYDRMRAAVARASGLEVHIADDLTFDPAWLAPGEAPRTFVHRGFMMEEMHDQGAFLRCLIAAGVPVYSLMEADIRMDKGWFALMWDAYRDGQCTAAEAALLEDFVPETWQVTAAMLDDFIARRNSLVFKSRRAFGGAGILIGAEITASALRAALAPAPECWIAQIMLQPERIAMPHHPGELAQPHELVYGLYLYGGVENGLLLRGSTTSRIVNVSSGRARISWALAIEAGARAAFLRQLQGDGR
jgi:hypothetical protein